jgi:hypothetical protein
MRLNLVSIVLALWASVASAYVVPGLFETSVHCRAECHHTIVPKCFDACGLLQDMESCQECMSLLHQECCECFGKPMCKK